MVIQTKELAQIREALQHAKARFECLAEDFKDDESNVNWAMCSVDAERMTRALELVGSPKP